jgi:hypothetical protein
LPNLDGTLALLSDIPSLTGFVPYTGATTNVDLGTHRILAQNATIASSGSGDTFTLNHSSGSGIGLNITKGGNGEGLYVNKTSGSGNAATIIGTLNATTLVKSGGTSAQILAADGSVITAGTNITISGGTISASGGGGTTIYTGDGTLSGNRTVTSNGNSLTILGGKENIVNNQTALELKTSAINKNLSIFLNNTTTTGKTYEIRSDSDGSFRFSQPGIATFFIRNSNSKISIGGVAPTGTADTTIFGYTNNTGAIKITGSNGGAIDGNGLELFFGSNLSCIYSLDRSGTIWRNIEIAALSTTFRNSGNTTMTLTAAGRLLLGLTAESTFLLDVNGTARVSGDMLVNGIKVGIGGGNVIGNAALGYEVLNNNTTGNSNVGIGYQALRLNTTGNNNIALGQSALYANTTASNNIAIGVNAMSSSTGNTSVAIGNNVLVNNSGSGNIGILGLTTANTSGVHNIALGVNALIANTSASHNISMGHFSLSLTTTGGNNIGIGGGTLYYNLTGTNNTAIGFNALAGTTTSNNIGLGYGAGYYITGGSTINSNPTNSIFIGFNSRANGTTETNQIVIGNTATGLGSNTTVIGNSSTTLTALYGAVITGGTSANASAQLQADSTTKGFLPPRMTNAQRTAISSPAVGLIVYCTDAVEGLYVYKSMGWTFVI